MHTPPADDARPVPVPDHELVRQIGSGSYGDVWLARNVFGIYRAVKIVRRSKFDSDRPFEREFNGIRKFEPVSRSHPGFIAILHVGRNEAEGYFYYIMELADDQQLGQQIVPDQYHARTLASEVCCRDRLPLRECVRLGLTITDALATLHGAGLVHRDIKPSNIIFVNGNPKLADIGLVHNIASAATFVGTQGFMPPEGPGTIQADLYALGKVLYELSTGNDRIQFPELPTFVTHAPAEEVALFRELNEVLVRACEANPARRYTSAAQLRSDLEVVAEGKSLRRLRVLERRLKFVGRAAVLTVVLGAAAAIVGFAILRSRARTAQARASQAATSVAYGSRLVAETDPFASLPWFIDAWQAHKGDADAVDADRVRIGAVLEYGPKLRHCWWQPTGVNYADFSPDGQLIAVGATDGTVTILGAHTGKVMATMRHGTNEAVNCVHFSLDGQRLVTTAGYSGVRIWNVADGRFIASVPVTRNFIHSARFSPDNRMIVTASYGGALQVWDAATQTLVRRLGGHQGASRNATFSPDSRRIVSAGHDGLLNVWDASSGARLLSIPNPGFTYDATFSPDGRWIATGTSERNALIYDAANGRPVFPPFLHRAHVGSTSFSPDGRYLVTATYGETIHVWDLAHGVQLFQLKMGNNVWHAAFSPDCRELLTASGDRTVRLWELDGTALGRAGSRNRFTADGSREFRVTNSTVTVVENNTSKRPTTIEAGYPVAAVICNESGSFLLFIPTDNSRRAGIAGFSMADGAQLLLPIPVGALSRDRCRIAGEQPVAATFGDCVVRTWNLRTGAQLGAWTNDVAVTNVVLSPDGKVMAVWARNVVQLVDTDGGKARGLPLRHDLDGVSVVEFSRNGRRVVTACADSGLTHGYGQVWDAATGAPIGPRLMHRDGVLCASFSPSGRFVATGGEDSKAQVWDTHSWRPYPAFEHGSRVRSVKFSDDDLWIVTASDDQTTVVWDVQRASALTPPLRHPFRVVNAAFIDSGRAIVTTTEWEVSRVLPMPRFTGSIESLRPLASFLSGEPAEHDADRRIIDGWVARGNKDSQTGGRLEESLSSAPLDPEWHLEQGVRCDNAELLFGARFHLEKAIQGGMRRPSVYLRLAEVEAKMGDYREALMNFDLGTRNSRPAPQILAKIVLLQMAVREDSRIVARKARDLMLVTPGDQDTTWSMVLAAAATQRAADLSSLIATLTTGPISPSVAAQLALLGAQRGDGEIIPDYEEYLGTHTEQATPECHAVRAFLLAGQSPELSRAALRGAQGASGANWQRRLRTEILSRRAEEALHPKSAIGGAEIDSE